MVKKIGIMGGTFNPIHIGHLVLAETARETLLLDEILFVPSGISYMKDGEEVLPAKRRTAMTSLAIENNPHFALSVIEAEKNQNSYTYETLTTLTERNPETEYYLIMGADSFFHIETWQHPEIIFSNCIVVAAVREGHNLKECEDKIRYFHETYGAKIQLLHCGRIDISSTSIREKVKKQESIRYLVPDSVIEYIRKKDLYC